MPKIIKAIIENGVLCPLSPLALSDGEKVEVIILQEGDDLPARARLGQGCLSLAFLLDPAEDIYSCTDGEPV